MSQIARWKQQLLEKGGRAFQAVNEAKNESQLKIDQMEKQSVVWHWRTIS